MRRHAHAPFEPTDPNICMWGPVTDVINCPFFWKTRQRVSELSDPEKYHFPLKSFIALTTVSALSPRLSHVPDVTNPSASCEQTVQVQRSSLCVYARRTRKRLPSNDHARPLANDLELACHFVTA